MQRSVDDPSLLVATYEGQHHHCSPGVGGGGGGVSSPGQPIPAVQCSGSTPSSDDFSKTQRASSAATESNEIQQIFVEKMASSLTRNPSFRTALAAAITGRIFDELISSDNDNINVSNSRGLSV